MNKNERNVRAFGAAKRHVRIRPAGGDDGEVGLSVTAPVIFAQGIIEASVRAGTENFHEFPIYLLPGAFPIGRARCYFRSERTRNRFMACLVAAITIVCVAEGRDLVASDRPPRELCDAIIRVESDLAPGGSPIANAARIVTVIQREQKRAITDRMAGGAHA